MKRFVHLFLISVKGSLLSLFSDPESDSIPSSMDEADRRSPSPQPSTGSDSSLLPPVYEGSPMGIFPPGFQGNKRPELTQTELQERFKKIIAAAVDFVLYTGRSKLEKKLNECINPDSV